MKKNRIASFALIVLTAVAGLTCRPNIGLGGQIDIVPPEGEITYPDAGETPIRGSFVLKGTASDDDGIESITVVFENIETKARSSVYTAEGFTVGSTPARWTVNVANEATGAEEAPHELVKIYPIPDGEYTAILTVTDKGGKSTTVTKNYKIDNTPPVFIVSRPSTVVNISGDSDPQADGYGATFSVIGQAGERNTVEKLNVLIPDTTPLINLSNMFVGNNINAQVAVYGTEPNALYDLQAEDRSKPIKGQLYLYDNAREYKYMDIDSHNGIHIAAFDSNDGDLKYFYLPSYGSSNSDLKSMTVDAAFSVGQWTQIKVRNDKPYIAYYNNTEAGQRSAIKLAVAEGTVVNGGIGTVAAGVDAQGFVTGKWDCMTVPTITPAQGGTPKFKKVNLGFDTQGRPVLGYLGDNIEFGKWLDE